MIWGDRKCVLEDGVFMASARGRHDDFDFYAGKEEEMAFAVGTGDDGNRFTAMDLDPCGDVWLRSGIGDFRLTIQDGKLTLTKRLNGE
jgi:hypothetical protein